MTERPVSKRVPRWMMGAVIAVVVVSLLAVVVLPLGSSLLLGPATPNNNTPPTTPANITPAIGPTIFFSDHTEHINETTTLALAHIITQKTDAVYVQIVSYSGSGATYISSISDNRSDAFISATNFTAVGGSMSWYYINNLPTGSQITIDTTFGVIGAGTSYFNTNDSVMAMVFGNVSRSSLDAFNSMGLGTSKTPNAVTTSTHYNDLILLGVLAYEPVGWTGTASGGDTLLNHSTETLISQAVYYEVVGAPASYTLTTSFLAAFNWYTVAVAIAPAVALASPTALHHGTVTTTTVPLAWTNPVTVTGDTVLQAIYVSSCGAFSTQYVEGNVTSYTVTGLVSGVAYCFEVEAVNGSTISNPSNTLSNVVTSHVPPPPSDLGVTSVTTTTLSINWVNPTGNVTSNDVYKATYSAGSCGTYTAIYVSGSVNTTFTVRGLSSGNDICIYVTAFNSSGQSGPSSALVNVVIGTPNPPTALTATTKNTTAINLAWTKPPGTLTDSHVYEYALGCESLLTSFDLGTATSFYDSANLSATTNYCFGVSASNATGEGPQAFVSNTTHPNAPTSVNAAAVNTTVVDLTWANPGVAGAVTDNIVFVSYAGCGVAVVQYDEHSAAQSATVSSLPPSTALCFKVQAETQGGGGVRSAGAESGTLPTAPTGLSATAASSTSVLLTWNNPVGNLTLNDVLYGTTCGSLISLVAIGSAVTTYTVTGLTASTSYCFEVNAATPGGFGVASASSSATTSAATPVGGFGVISTMDWEYIALAAAAAVLVIAVVYHYEGRNRPRTPTGGYRH